MLKNDGGWRKNFRRVKQQMDQNLGRSEKSEVLSEDLVILEKRVECIKHTCHNTVKKVSAMVPNTGNDSEKRLKKLPEWSLHTSMEESSNMLGAESLLGKMYHLCGDVESSLAKERQDMEYAIENCLIQPFHQILEHDIPTVTKLRKQLSKLVLDMDHAKNRYHSVSRQSQAAGHTKIDSIKDEYEDSQIRVDQARDQLATEMYSFVSKEAEYSHMLMKLLEVQANYHQQALELIKSSLPEMEKQLEKSTQMPMFGQDLLDHLRRADRDIAVVLEVCICSLIEFGLDEEGLFRVAGPAPKLKKLKASFDSGSTIDMADYDVHCVTGALKQYLRELPEPLLTYSLYDKWIQAVHLPQEQRLQELWRVLDVLPQPNYNNLRYLIKFLAKVADKADVNKMSPSNLAIVIGPNLLWPEGDVGPSMLTTGSQSAIVEAMVTHADWFFPGDLEYASTSSLASGPNPLILPLQGDTGSNEAPPSYATQVPQPAPVQQTVAPGHPAPPHPATSAHPADPVMTSPHTSPHMYPAQPPSQPNNVGLHSPSQEGGPTKPTRRRGPKKPAPPPPKDRPPKPPAPTKEPDPQVATPTRPYSALETKSSPTASPVVRPVSQVIRNTSNTDLTDSGVTTDPLVYPTLPPSPKDLRRPSAEPDVSVVPPSPKGPHPNLPPKPPLDRKASTTSFEFIDASPSSLTEPEPVSLPPPSIPPPPLPGDYMNVKQCELPPLDAPPPPPGDVQQCLASAGTHPPLSPRPSMPPPPPPEGQSS